MSLIRLIVGLGNPGSDYALTRHNVGAWYAEALARKHQQILRLENKFHVQAAKISLNSHHCWVTVPSTYMNESGLAVASFARFYQIKPQEILVAHDELDFSVGTIRLKEDGGHGGHNGLRSIIQHLGATNFCRLRIGIGHPGHRDQVTSYVLGPPSAGDKTIILQSLQEGLDILPLLLSGEMQKAMQKLHLRRIE